MKLILTAVALFSLMLGCCTVPERPIEPSPQESPQVPPSPLVDIGVFSEQELAIAAIAVAAIAESGQKVIWFRIDSPGGNVYTGMHFIQYVEDLKRSYGIKTKCVVDFNALSMGFYFLQSPACDERLATNRSILMVHKSRRADDSNSTLGDELTNTINEALIAIGSKRLLISKDVFKERIEAGDWYFSAEFALKIGAIDGIIESSELPAP
jgi:ATP-dependent protease ClpP protease subunit